MRADILYYANLLLFVFAFGRHGQYSHFHFQWLFICGVTVGDVGGGGRGEGDTGKGSAPRYYIPCKVLHRVHQWFL